MLPSFDTRKLLTERNKYLQTCKKVYVSAFSVRTFL